MYSAAGVIVATWRLGKEPARASVMVTVAVSLATVATKFEVFVVVTYVMIVLEKCQRLTSNSTQRRLTFW